MFILIETSMSYGCIEQPSITLFHKLSVARRYMRKAVKEECDDAFDGMSRKEITQFKDDSVFIKEIGKDSAYVSYTEHYTAWTIRDLDTAMTIPVIPG